MRPVRGADNLTTFMCRLAWNLGSSSSWNPWGLSRPVQGLFTIYFINHSNNSMLIYHGITVILIIPWYYDVVWHSLKWLQEYDCMVKGKAVPLEAWSGPEGSRNLRFPDFMTTAQEGGKFVSLTHRPTLLQEMLLVLIYVRGWVDPRAIVRSEGFYVNEKSTDTSWDRTSDLPIRSTTP